MNIESLQMQQTRRTFINRGTVGIGAAALSSMLGPSLAHAANKANAPTIAGGPGAGMGMINPRHFAPKAKRVIFLCMAGGPSHLESFDYKPELEKLNGQAMPESYTAGMPIAQLQGKALKAAGPMATFKQYGQSGHAISEYFPHIAGIADDICIVKSMVTEQINHDPAHTFMNTGTAISGRPSMGSWVLYGLGAETNNLPGFVVLTSVGGRNPQPIAARQWSSGFLPSEHQGVEFYSAGDPVHYLSNPGGYNRSRQLDVVSAVNQLDALRNEHVDNPEILTRIKAYEKAARMQLSVPELMDMSDEPSSIMDMYGVKQAGEGTFASNCLLARRLAERGVRFIHLYHRGWDHHGGLKKFMGICSGFTDQPTAALIKDLKARGMLEDTLVVWGGEFGRTPMAQGDGRDHHIKGFSIFMAGGGIKPGISYGETDPLGYAAVKDVVHVRDFHATMLHLLGIDHQRMTVQHQGLDMKLTGVETARVVHDIIA